MKWRWWLAAALVAGLVAGVAWPPPPIPRATLASAETWQLPSPAELARFDPATVEQVRAGVSWLGETPDAVESAAQGPWKLAGIVFSPEPLALVQPASGKLQELPVGSTLPDGSTLVRLDADGMTTERDGCQQLYQLHRGQPAGDPCPQAAP